MGPLSSIGLRIVRDNFEYDINFESTFPLTAAFTKKLLSFANDNSLSYKEAFAKGSALWKGLDMSWYVNFPGHLQEKVQYGIGLNAKAALIDFNDLYSFSDTFSSVAAVTVSPSVKVAYNVRENLGMQINIGIPCLIIIHGIQDPDVPDSYPWTTVESPMLYKEIAQYYGSNDIVPGLLALSSLLTFKISHYFCM